MNLLLIKGDEHILIIKSILCIQLLEGKYDFFPVGRAISLLHIDEDETKKSLEELSGKVEKLNLKIDKIERNVSA